MKRIRLRPDSRPIRGRTRRSSGVIPSKELTPQEPESQERKFRKLRGGSMGLKGKHIDFHKLLEMTSYRPLETESSNQDESLQ